MNLYGYLDWEFNLGPNSGMQTVVPLCLPCCTENCFCLKSFCLARKRAVNLYILRLWGGVIDSSLYFLNTIHSFLFHYF